MIACLIYIFITEGFRGALLGNFNARDCLDGMQCKEIPRVIHKERPSFFFMTKHSLAVTRFSKVPSAVFSGLMEKGQVYPSPVWPQDLHFQ
jgi:hypothetical protein